MITSVSLKNFKCFEEVKVDLEPFTVLIGPNDSGKTSFVEAIELLFKTSNQDLQTVFALNDRSETLLSQIVRDHHPTKKVLWNVKGTVNDKTFGYTLEVPANFVGRSEPMYHEQLSYEDLPFEVIKVGQPVPINKKVNIQSQATHTMLCQCRQNLVPVVEGILGNFLMARFRLDPSALRSSGNPQPTPQLSPSGNNLISVLDWIVSGEDSQARTTLEAALSEALPSLMGISLAVDQNGMKTLRFKTSGVPAIILPAHLVSDGAVLLLAYLAMAASSLSPPLLVIEEPENGIHPSLLKKVIGILRSISERSSNRRQVIVTTHSPLLLNFIPPEEVRIFSRKGAGPTRVDTLSKLPKFEELRKEFAPGEMWYLFGEEDLIKGADK